MHLQQMLFADKIIKTVLKETAKIVAIDTDALWVETIQRSVCGSCVAQKGCGQTLLNRLGAKPVYLRVLLDGRDASNYQIGQRINIGIPDDVVVKSSLLAYLLPLAGSLVFAAVVHTFYDEEWITLLSMLLGLSLGSFIVNYCTKRYRNDQRYQPVILDEKGISNDNVKHLYP